MSDRTTHKKLTIAIAQLDSVWENPEANQQQVEKVVATTARKAVDFIVFPEMFLTGFSMRVALYSSTADILFFQKLARKHAVGIIIGLGVKEKHARVGENQAVVISKTGKLLSQYNKIHPFSFAQEHTAIRAGVQLPTFKIAGHKAACVICYDLRFPGLFEVLAKQRIELLFVIANWPQARIADWRTLLRARALDMQSFVIGVNRVGTANGLLYPGYSSVYGPRGEKIIEMTKKGVQLVCIEPTAVRVARNSFPSLRDKKFSVYQKLNKK